MKNFRLQILTPDRSVFDGEVSSLNFPSADGWLGVLADHAPLMAVAGHGQMTAKLPDKQVFSLVLTGGILKLKNNLAQLFIG